VNFITLSKIDVVSHNTLLKSVISNLVKKLVLIPIMLSSKCITLTDLKLVTASIMIIPNNVPMDLSAVSSMKKVSSESLYYIKWVWTTNSSFLITKLSCVLSIKHIVDSTAFMRTINKILEENLFVTIDSHTKRVIVDNGRSFRTLTFTLKEDVLLCWLVTMHMVGKNMTIILWSTRHELANRVPIVSSKILIVLSITQI
jgi:hypothetical protein